MSEQVGDPMDENAVRSLVSFVRFAYNRKPYILEGLNVALPQTFLPLETNIPDGCLMSNTFSVIAEMTANYRSSLALVVRKNNHNLKLAAHEYQVKTRVSSEHFVVAASYVFSFSDRVSIVTEDWIKG